jgi:hypothetical protein
VVKKSSKQIERDIAAFLGPEATLYWPGGSGGGGSRKRVSGNPVVRPHARTYPTCRRCGQFHTTAEHELEETGGVPAQPGRRAPRTKARRAASTAAITSARPAQRRPTSPAQAPLALVRHAVAAVKGPGRFGDRKVFVSALWQRVGRKVGMSLDEFKQWLFSQHRAGAVQLARADLVAAMDPKLVASSEIRVPGAEFHFVVDPEPRGPR